MRSSKEAGTSIPPDALHASRYRRDGGKAIGISAHFRAASSSRTQASLDSPFSRDDSFINRKSFLIMWSKLGTHSTNAGMYPNTTVTSPRCNCRHVFGFKLLAIHSEDRVMCTNENLP